jgi:hypothetical protein
MRAGSTRSRSTSGRPGARRSELFRALESEGASLILCRTCLEYFGLKDKVQVGQVGGMPAILEAMTRADKVMSVCPYTGPQTGPLSMDPSAVLLPTGTVWG